jgi:hypothetical protein
VRPTSEISHYRLSCGAHVLLFSSWYLANMCFELPPCLFRMQMANRGDEARTNVGIHPVRILPIAFPAICIYMPQHSFAGSGLAYHNVTDSFCHLMSYFSW